MISPVGFADSNYYDEEEGDDRDNESGTDQGYARTIGDVVQQDSHQ